MKQQEEIWKALLPNESESEEEIHLIKCEICDGVFGGAQDEIHNIPETHKTNEHYDLILRHTFYKRRSGTREKPNGLELIFFHRAGRGCGNILRID